MSRESAYQSTKSDVVTLDYEPNFCQFVSELFSCVSIPECNKSPNDGVFIYNMLFKVTLPHKYTESLGNEE